MKFPTLSGAVAAPFAALGIEDDDTFTAQEATDLFFGGLGYGYGAHAVRTMYAMKAQGPRAEATLQEALIWGVL